MPSHNVAVIQNITTNWKLNITKVVAENNGVWQINLATPNTLLGTWVLEVELDNLGGIIDPLLRLDVSIEVQIVSINTKDCGK
jgi:hypothetical protein